MKLLVEATAAHRHNSGVVAWLRGLIKGSTELDSNTEWTIVGPVDFDPDLRTAAESANWNVILPSGVKSKSRILLQQWTVPRMARSMDAQALVSATTVIPMRSSVPTISILHDFRYLTEPEAFSLAQRSYRGFAYRYALRHASRLVAISNATAESAVELEPTANGRLIVAHHGSNHVESWTNSATTVPYAIAFAQWSNKRPEMSIDIWAHLSKIYQGSDVKLHLVGVPDRGRQTLADRAESNGIGHLVELHGKLEAVELEQLFASATLLLMPSSHEGLGLPVLESMALGIPAVVSDIPPFREAAGETVLYSELDDTESFALHCRAVLEGQPESIELAKQARDRAKEFTWAGVAKAIVDAATQTQLTDSES